MNRLIKTEEDYEKAMSRIEMVMGAEPGTPEMDELELLTALVEMYEDRHFPIDPPDPVEAIKFRMDQIGLRQKDLIPFIGSKSKVSEVLNRKRPLTLAMMRALNKELGISAEVLLNEPGRDFPQNMLDVDWSRFPVVEMAKRGWFPKLKNLKERSEEVMRDLMINAGVTESATPVFLRQGKRGLYRDEADSYAISAWVMRVLSLARQSSLRGSYAKKSLKLSTMRDIARLSYFDNGPILAREYLNKQGIHLIIVRHLPKTYLDGAALLMPDGTPVVGLTLRYDRIDNFWFCLMHELAHVVKHISESEPVIVDDLDLQKSGATTEDEIENEANELAQEALVPKKTWKELISNKKITGQQLHALAEKLKIHPAVLAGRIRFERNNYNLLTRHVGQGEIRKHFDQMCQEEAA
ncbi:MAG: ImmA/IrrE family metallo-endopeptidase [Deltaproteobacteria bacterium]|nr:ImmA/IrrE family metallo-endopeptidase [Deltaproteobacteria bacterium]